MNITTMLVALGALAALAAGGWAWRKRAPQSFWYAVEFPAKATLVYLTWTHIAAGCGLSRKRRRWRFALDAVPLAGAVSHTVQDAVMIQRRRVRSVEIEKAPRLRLLRPTPLVWRVWVKLADPGSSRPRTRVRGLSFLTRSALSFAV